MKNDKYIFWNAEDYKSEEEKQTSFDETVEKLRDA